MDCDSKEDEIYARKYQCLKEYYNHVFEHNRRLQHRIYHVKKEINHLKHLKRTLCERLMRHKSVLVDFNLEIPDDDTGVGDHVATFPSAIAGPFLASSHDDHASQSKASEFNSRAVVDSPPPSALSLQSSIDRVIGDVVTSAASASNSFTKPMAAANLRPPPKQRRRRAPNAEPGNKRRRERQPTAPRLSLDSTTERNIIAIIDSVVNETHDDALRDAAQQSTTMQVPLSGETSDSPRL